MAGWLDQLLGALLGRLTADPQERRNTVWLALASLLYGAGMALFSGELWNGFLKQAGFSLTQIGLVGTVFGVAMATGLVAFLGLADRCQRPVRTYALTTAVLAQAPLLTAGVTLLTRHGLSVAGLYWSLLAIVGVQALLAAIPVTLETPVLALAASPGLRGRVLAIATTATGVLGIGLGWLSAEVLEHLAYPQGYLWCFVAAAVLLLLRSLAFSRIEVLPAQQVHRPPTASLPPRTALVRLLRLPEFQVLAGPHLARGLLMGLTGLMLPVALVHLHLPTYFPGYASSVATLGTVLGGVVLGFLADRLGAARTCLLSGVLYGLGLAITLVSPHPVAFLGLYLLLQIGRNVEDNAVPLGTLEMVRPAYLASVSAGRLMVLMAGSAVGGPLFGYLFDHYPALPVALLGAALKLATGLWLFLVFWRGKSLHEPAA